MRAIVFLILFSFGGQYVAAQQAYPLYDRQIPNALGTLKEKDKPFITAHLPAQPAANSPAIIVIPGGGYRTLVTKTEGKPIADAFAAKGIPAFVLHYRLPDDSLMSNKEVVPLMDAQQAIRWVKTHATAFGVDTSRLGIIGYSAGGHLAATLGTHFEPALIANPEQLSLRPAFMVLVYPVVNMETTLAHSGSRNALLGPSPSAETVRFFSADRNVSKDTPPAYLIHSVTDSTVSVSNSMVLFDALCKNGVDAELHLSSKGPHGFVHTYEVDDWIDPVWSWFKRVKILLH